MCVAADNPSDTYEVRKSRRNRLEVSFEFRDEIGLIRQRVQEEQA